MIVWLLLTLRELLLMDKSTIPEIKLATARVMFSAYGLILACALIFDPINCGQSGRVISLQAKDLSHTAFGKKLNYIDIFEPNGRFSPSSIRSISLLFIVSDLYNFYSFGGRKGDMCLS